MNLTKILNWNFPEDAHGNGSYDWCNIYFCVIQTLSVLAAAYLKRRMNIQAALWFFLYFQIAHLLSHITGAKIYYYFLHYSFLTAGLFLAREFRKLSAMQALVVISIDGVGIILFGEVCGILSALVLVWAAVARDRVLNVVFLSSFLISFSSLVVNDVIYSGNHEKTEMVIVLGATICNVALLCRSS